MSDLNPLIRAQINDVRQGRTTTLNMGLFSLKEIPEEIFELSSLTELSLASTGIRIVPERIRQLSSLRRLNLNGNPIEKVPDIPGLELDWETYLRCRHDLTPTNIVGLYVNTGETPSDNKPVSKGSCLVPAIADMTFLQHLSIGVHSIPLGSGERPRKPCSSVSYLIESLPRFAQLQQLSLFGIELGDVPPPVRKLKSLRRLQAACAGLHALPDWLSELTEIRVIQAPFNAIASLPESLADLDNLQQVDLAGNPLTEIPAVLFRVRSLAHVDLSSWEPKGGHIKLVPTSILDLPNLQTLQLEGHSTETPPPEVVKDGVEAIKNYWRQREEAGVDYLCEAKLIIVGEAGAGKTSLARKIQNPAYQLTPAEASTEGIEIVRWSFPSAVRATVEGKEEVLPRDFKVNIWDFGGQEVYHSTHQFFLTRRSLYLLVADDRKEDTDFNYWLQVVELLSDQSPILIVQNEKQDRRRDLDLGSLRARFANLKEAFPVNLATGRGMEGLMTAIRHYLDHLPHIGTPLPRTWRRVREALEADPRNHIALDEYLSICKSNGFKQSRDGLQLSGYLHDLGICLHFQDDSVLRRTVILKPKWGTDAVYRVLDDHTVIDHHGTFGTEDLERIWSEADHASMRDELLRLMMRFQLCYELPEGGSYIAPQLLPTSAPTYPWTKGGDMVLRYEYDFMPKGLLTRLIVALHHLIADQSLVWRNGVILERAGTRGEVIEDYPRRRITVRLCGPDLRGLLAIIDDRLGSLHRLYPRLRYDMFLPCNCCVCRERPEPHAYAYRTLLDFARTADSIQCHVSRKMVDAAALIRDIFPASRQPVDRIGPEHDSEENRRPDYLQPTLPREVFVSYAWTTASKHAVDRLEAALKERGIHLLRDRNELRYKDPITEFMRRIGRGKCILVVLSKSYLESKNCMFELTEIADRGDISDRVFPIILDDANIYDAMGRLGYIKYWENKKVELDMAMKEVGGENLEGIREELDLIAKIRTTIAGIVNILGNMNTPSLAEQEEKRFDELLRLLESRLSD